MGEDKKPDYSKYITLKDTYKEIERWKEATEAAQLAQQLRPDNMDLVKRLEASAGLARSLPFEVNIWRTQNIYYQMLQKIYPERRERAIQGDSTPAREWVEHFVALGQNLAVKVDMPAEGSVVLKDRPAATAGGIVVVESVPGELDTGAPIAAHRAPVDGPFQRDET